MLQEASGLMLFLTNIPGKCYYAVDSSSKQSTLIAARKEGHELAVSILVHQKSSAIRYVLKRMGYDSQQY